MLSKKPICILRAAIYVCGGLAGTFQFLSALLSFDPNANYFLGGAILPIFAIVFALLGVGSAVAFAFLDKEERPRASRFAFLPPAIFFCALFPAVLSFANGSSPIADRLAVVSAILLLLSALYCLLSIFLNDQKHRGILALLGFSPVLALASLALFFYFDKSIEMNSPLKVSLQAGLLFGMFLFLCELRRLLGRPLPKLLLGLRLSLFPIASLGSCLLVPLVITGGCKRLDYLFGALLLLSLQIALLFDLFSTRKNS